MPNVDVLESPCLHSSGRTEQLFRSPGWGSCYHPEGGFGEIPCINSGAVKTSASRYQSLTKDTHCILILELGVSVLPFHLFQDSSLWQSSILEPASSLFKADFHPWRNSWGNWVTNKVTHKRPCPFQIKGSTRKHSGFSLLFGKHQIQTMKHLRAYAFSHFLQPSFTRQLYYR